jgi:hypothetical protein
MYKLIFILYTITNMYDCFINSKDTPTNNMKEFIENQQYREDQLRNKCHLNDFIIEPRKNLYEKIYDDIKNYINNNLSENLYPIIYNLPINCETYNEFMDISHNEYNVNREIIYHDKLFLLKNNHPPLWRLQIDNLELEISDIKEYYY